MALRYDTVSFLSDYGRRDEFVGVVHSVIRQLAHGVGVVDVTHDIPPFDVRAGGLALARSAPYLCPGVVLAVVDPGVGTDRRPVAVEVGGGTAVLVGPDNGLLAPAVALVGGATRAVVLDNPEYHLEGRALFDGRDVFAPVAAHLCLGEPLEQFGTEIDPAGMVPGLMPVAREEDGAVVAEVLWVDHYGNAQLNVDPDELDLLGERFELKVTAGRWTGVRARAFAGVVPGTVGMVTDSSGLLALVADRSSAAEELGLAAGDEVIVTPIEGRGEVAPAVEVQLGRRDRGGAR